MIRAGGYGKHRLVAPGNFTSCLGLAEVGKLIGLSMFQVLEESSGNFIALKALGKITAKDYDTLVPYLEMAIEREGSLYFFAI